MTQSVAQKTSISEKTWKRQTNSPSWWIAFSCGSIILHVLALWLVSLYTQNSFLKARSQSAVAIEFIEFSPQKSSPVKPLPKSQPKPKAVSPKPKPIPDNSQPNNLSTVVKPPISTNDRDAIAFNNQKIQEQFEKQQKKLELAQQQRQQEAQKRQLEALQRQQEAEQQRQLAEQLRQRAAQQQQLEAQLRQREAEQQRQLAEKLRQQEQLQRELEQRLRQREAQQLLQQQRLRQREAQQRQLEQAQRQQEIQEQQRLLAEKLRQQEVEEKQRLLAEKLRQQEIQEQQRLLAEKLRQQEIQEQQRLLAEKKLRQRQLNQQQNQNPADGKQITDAIQNKLGQTPQQRQVPSPVPIKETQLNQSGGILTANWNVADKAITRDIPTNPPKPKQNISQSFVIPATDANNLESGNFLVYLMINEEGTVEFTRVDENIPVEKRQLYQKYVDKQLLNKKLFNPATDADPTTGQLKPRRGELYIRIKIQRGY